MRCSTTLSILLLATALGGAACNSAGTGDAGTSDDANATSGPAAEAAPVDDRGARTLPFPDGQAGTRANPHAGAGSASRLHWTVPESWTEVQPSSSMRIAQYEVSGPGGPAEMVVYYFGPGQGGDPRANAMRWAGQFTQPDGTPSTETMIFEPVEGAQVPAHVVEVTGTYDGGMTMTAQPSQPQPDAMLLGGIARGGDAPWFFKLTGPEATVRPQREAFLEMMRSLHPEH